MDEGSRRLFIVEPALSPRGKQVDDFPQSRKKRHAHIGGAQEGYRRPLTCLTGNPRLGGAKLSLKRLQGSHGRLVHRRRRLAANPSHREHIITEPGMGYRFEACPDFHT